MEDANGDGSGPDNMLPGQNPTLPSPEGATARAVTQTAFNVVRAWSMPRNASYEGQLCYFMAFVHGRDFEKYPTGTLFTRVQLLEIQPQHVHDFLALKAFKKVDYSIEAGDKPIHGRSSSMEFTKKAISFFMPNHNPHWCNDAGNPTKHQMHRKLIDLVKLMEVRGEGSDSKTKRALSIVEWYKELEMLRAYGTTKNDYNFAVKYPAMTVWQYHLIGRIDDVCNFGMSNPKGHELFPFAMKTKVQWSKNVRDEQKCPDQILLGSEDRYDVLTLYVRFDQYPI